MLDKSLIINFIGIIGVFFVLLAYLLLQTNKLSQSNLYFSLLNTVGSFAILFSLFFYWNLASFIIEGAWLAISLFGLIKSIKSIMILE